MGELEGLVACPRCRSERGLTIAHTKRLWECGECGARYPIVRETPILIVEERSVFRFADYQANEPVSLAYSPRRRLVQLLAGLMPAITENREAGTRYEKVLQRLREREDIRKKRVLVVGAGDGGEGIGPLRAATDILVTETDVYFGERVAIVCDGHDLPFHDATFDLVVFQAVLEHVADPNRCVSEGHRVLREDGLIYAETPFMYPVHLGAYDFTRFSLSGHRRLFRFFTELDVGVVAGAGTALALSFRSFLLVLSSSRAYQGVVRLFSPLALFWLKYVDRWTNKKPHASDYACTTYFLGRKAPLPIPDTEIVNRYQR